VRTVILGDPPKEIEELIESRRIPDSGLHRDASDSVDVDSAPLVIDVLSPDDETMEKIPFYASRGVEEVVIVDPLERRVTWLGLAGTAYVQVDRSELLDLDVAAFAAQIDWPPVG
jgi:Uma2 family endonuclease